MPWLARTGAHTLSKSNQRHKIRMILFWLLINKEWCTSLHVAILSSRATKIRYRYIVPTTAATTVVVTHDVLVSSFFFRDIRIRYLCINLGDCNETDQSRERAPSKIVSDQRRGYLFSHVQAPRLTRMSNAQEHSVKCRFLIQNDTSRIPKRQVWE